MLLGSFYSGSWDQKDFLNSIRRYELGGENEGLGLAGNAYEEEKRGLSDMAREFIEIIDLSRQSRLSYSPGSSASFAGLADPHDVVELSGIEAIRGPERLL